MNSFIRSNWLFLVIFIGLSVRVVFLLFGAEIYYGRELFYIDGDTDSYVRPIRYLFEFGTYSANLDHEFGPFLRTPGYPFYFGLFYLTSGFDLDLAYKLTIWSQVILDTISIFLVYKIGLKLFSKKSTSLILASFYAFYPFTFVWVAVIQAETLSTLFLLLSFYLFLNKNSFWCGIVIALAVLTRPQLGLLIPCYICATLYSNRSLFTSIIIPPKAITKSIIKLILGFVLLFSIWPMRNYLNHDKLIFFHDYSCGNEWDVDFTSYWDYIFSVKAEWEPQFSGIIQNKTVNYPKAAYKVPGDSIKLAQAIFLAQNCGSSFSWRTGYWKEKIQVHEPNCNDEIATLFNELRTNQIKHNPINYYLVIPLKNLKKSIFKSGLYDQESLVRKLASYLFYYRTLLLLLGILGSIYILVKSNNKLLKEGTLAILFFTVSWYFYMSFIHRNIEIRYFLPTDILLLIPASYLVYQWSTRKSLKK